MWEKLLVITLVSVTTVTIGVLYIIRIINNIIKEKEKQIDDYFTSKSYLKP